MARSKGEFFEVRSQGELAVKRRATVRATALLFSFLMVVSAFADKAAAQTCSSMNPDKVQSMIRELKDTFECSGLNLKSCNQYRAGLVGGSLAASTAAGLALLKRNSAITCALPGAKTSLTSGQRYDFIAQLIFGDEAAAAIAGTSAKGCSVPRQTMVKELEGLQKDFSRESSRITGEMKDRMVAERVPPPDLKKISVTEGDWKNKFSSGLEALEKEVKATSIVDPTTKQQLLNLIADQKEALNSVSLKSIPSQVVQSYDTIVGHMPAALKDGLSEEATKAISYWNISDTVRAEKAAKLPNTATQKVLAEVENDLSKLGGMAREAERSEFLLQRGYKADMVKQLIEIDNSRRTLSLNSSMLRITNHELTMGARFKNAAVITATEMRELARKNGLRFLDSPLFHFREIPGLNNGLLATVSRAGKKALAEATAVGASRLATVAKVAAPVLSVAGKAMAAPVEIFVEGVTHTNDLHCGGQMTSKYADLVSTENEKGGESCRPVNERTKRSDDFLFGLSFDDQLKEVRNNEVSCQMLTQLYARYAPSQNWNLTCSSGSNGPVATLNGKSAKGEGQMVTFNASDRNAIQNVEWYSSTFERCAKVALKDDAFESAQVYGMKTGMSSCGSVGSATTLGKSVLNTRQNQSDERKMLTEFVLWQASNSSVLGMAAECCGGSADNAMCPKASGGRGSRPAGSSTSGDRTTRR